MASLSCISSTPKFFQFFSVRCKKSGHNHILNVKFILILQETHLEKSSRQIFGCHLCPKSLLIPAGLQSHIRICHEHQKNYVCAFCGKRFSTSVNMRQHVVTRHAENKELIHSCNTCEYKTHSKVNLVQHVKRHGPRKHACYFCYKKFHTFRELVRHSGGKHTLEK